MHLILTPRQHRHRERRGVRQLEHPPVVVPPAHQRVVLAVGQDDRVPQAAVAAPGRVGDAGNLSAPLCLEKLQRHVEHLPQVVVVRHEPRADDAADGHEVRDREAEAAKVLEDLPLVEAVEDEERGGDGVVKGPEDGEHEVPAVDCFVFLFFDRFVFVFVCIVFRVGGLVGVALAGATRKRGEG